MSIILKMKDLYLKYPEIVTEMKSKIDSFSSLRIEQRTPRYPVGREGFVAPKDWIIEDD